ncbi:hypothetical protein ACFQ0T_21275 [Kitasatospora gansuensis]
MAAAVASAARLCSRTTTEGSSTPSSRSAASAEQAVEPAPSTTAEPGEPTPASCSAVSIAYTSVLSP